MTDTLTDSLDVAAPPAQVPHRYCVYGITVGSELPLALPEYAHGELAMIELRTAPEELLAELVAGVDFHPGSDSWYQYAFLTDGSTYVRWGGVGEFLVSSEGNRILCRRFEEASFESFQVYMLGQALSFALVKSGFEPLHATTVVVDGRAAAFLGDSGFGKSSLAASFLQAGHRILTDDLLIVQPSDAGLVAYPGPPRLKLFAEMARRLLSDPAVGIPMNLGTDKLILPLSPHQSCAVPVPLAAIYSLTPPSEVAGAHAISIQVLSGRESFLALVKNTFNRRLVNSERLQRQLTAMTQLANLMPVKRLSYPRLLDRLSEVRTAIESDLRGDACEAMDGTAVEPARS